MIAAVDFCHHPTLKAGPVIPIVILVLLSWEPSTGLAEPLYSDCPQTTLIDWNEDGDEEAYYYISSTFGADLNACRPGTAPGELLTEGQARTVVMAAAETWNTESRGRALIFDGVLATTSPTTACAWIMANPTFYKTPAVFVRFQKGCKKENGVCAAKALVGEMSTINPACTAAKISQLIIYGTDYDTADSGKASDADCLEVPDDDGVDCLKFPADCDADTLPEVTRNRFYVKTDYDATALDAADLPGLLLHEFGHVLGLHHTEGSPNATTKAAPAVMSNAKTTWPAPYRPSSNPGFLGFWHARRHLYPADTDCLNLAADSISGDTTRDLELYWRGYKTSSPVGWTSISTDGWYSTAKGFTSGGSIRDASGTTVLGFFEQYQSEGYFHHGSINADGTLPFTWSAATAHANMPGTSLDRINTPPTVFSPYETNDSDKRAIALLPSYETSPLMVTAANLPSIEPPRWSWLRSGTVWASGSTLTEAVSVCPSGVTCALATVTRLQTHLPVPTSYDAASDQTMVARVDTSKIEPDLNARVWVHPGFHALSSRWLRPGRELDITTFTTIPSQPTPFVYLGESETSPALACGPAWTQIYLANNCLLAWVDRGGPTGHILYTYFRYSASTDTLTWHDTVYRLNNAWTVGRPSAAFFNGAFWIAYKKPSGKEWPSWRVPGASDVALRSLHWGSAPRGRR